MAKQKEKTFEELLQVTEELTDFRPSWVLEGKARMRGPGVNDEEPSEGTSSREVVCDICGGQGQETDLKICSTCGRGFHTSCLGLPINESVGIDWLCSECQSINSGPHQASEPCLDSSCGIDGEKGMTCTVDSKADEQDDLLKDERLSISQLTSCLGSKPVARVEDAVEKTLEQPDRELDAMETASHSELEESGKSGLGSGEPSEQSPTPEKVRRSKRGRPYKPVGGLHPNKRRSVEGTRVQTDKAQQGRSRLVVDEEDELGAKIEKFRVISSIDEKSVRKGPPGWEDSKKADFGQALKWDEEDGSTRTISTVDAQEEQTSPPRKNEEVISGLESPRFATEGRTLEGRKIIGVPPRGSVDGKTPGGIVHDTGQGKMNVEGAVLKVEHDGPEGLPGGSLAPNDCQTDGHAFEGGHSVQIESQHALPEEKLGTELAENPREGQVKAERFGVTESSTSEKGGRKSASGSSDKKIGIKRMEKVHPASPKLETPRSFLTPRDTSNDHIVNDGGLFNSISVETTQVCNKVSKDGLKTIESSKSGEGDKELRKLVSHVKGVGMEEDFEHFGKVIPKVQEAVLGGHPKASARDASGQRKPKITSPGGLEDQSKVETTGKGETGEKIIPAVTATATPGVVHSGGNPVDSTDRMCKRDLPGGTSSSPEVVGKGTRGLQSASLEDGDDVKVCDICGDTGYEECLTLCSVCNEGAEHIYCMQALLQAVPEEWLCETCKLKGQNGNSKKVEDLPLNQAPSKAAYTSPKKGQIIKGNTRSRLSALLDKGKGSSSQKVVSKGPSTNQLPTKRPADDTQTAPSMKRLVRENMRAPSTVTNAFTPRGLTRENSVKAPDSGKVKFLSPNALATNPAAGGSRSLSKSSSFAGLPSQSLRPGMNQLSQVTGKNRYASNSYASGDSVISGTSPATKQSPPAPRPPSFNATAPTLSAGRGTGSLKSTEPLPSFLLPSRSGPSAFAKGSKDGNSEGNGLHAFGRDVNSISAGGGSAKGWGASSSGKLTTKWIDTPRPSTQSTSVGRQISGKGDAAISSQSLDKNVVPGRPLVVQNRSQTVDATRGLNNLARWPSLGRLSNQQASRDEAQRNSEVQPVKGSRQPPKVLDSVDPGTSRVGSLLDLQTNSNKLASGASLDFDLGRKGDQQIQDVPKTRKLNSSGTVFVNGQKSTVGSPHSSELPIGEDGKRPSKASRSGSPTKQFVVDATPKDMPVSEKGSKRRDNSEKGWSSSTLVAPVVSRRCYTCKEMGHSAQDCSTRSTGTLSLADLCASSSKGHVSTSIPKEGVGGLNSSLMGQRPSESTPLEALKSAAKSSVDQDSASQMLDMECAGSFPVSDPATVVQQGQSKDAETGIVGKVSKCSTEDKRKQISTPLLLNQRGSVPRLCGQSAPLTAIAPKADLQSLPVGKSTEAFDVKTSVRTDGPPPAPLSISHVSQPEGFACGDLAAPGTSTEPQKSDTVAKTIQGDSSRLSSEGEQVAIRQKDMAGGSVSQVLPPPPPLPAPPPLGRQWGENRPLEPPLATPMMKLMKGSVPWGQLASPRPFLGVDRVVNQDAWGKRSAVGPGIGASASWNPCPKAVPESQCLWRGGFEVISAAVPAFYDGIQAYSSSFAAPQVRAVTKTLPQRLQLEEVRRMFNADAWPKQFQQRHPTDKEIALYFFPESESCGGGYMMLLEHMKNHDLVLMGQVEGAELLIFPSHLLPVESHHWKSKMFLWGVYRAKRSKLVFKPMPPDSVQTSAQVLVNSPMKVAAPSEPEKVVRPGTAVISSTRDAGEADMEIDMVGDKELVIPPRNPSQSAVCDQPPPVKLPGPPAASTPPLPHEPPPVQPPPPDVIAPCVQEVEAAQVISLTGIKSGGCGLAAVDLPPGFGPGPQKRVPPLSQPPDVNNTPSGLPELKSDSDAPPGFAKLTPPGFEKITPPGFEKLREGVSTIQTQVHAEDTAGSTTDVDNPELRGNQLTLKRENNAAERSWPSMSSRRTSPFPHPSPSPRDLRDDSAGTFWLSTPRRSHSSSKSPKRHRDRIKDHRGGRTSFDGRESGRGRDSRRESGRGRETGREMGPARESGRDREKGRDSERGRDRESGRVQEKGRDRERERGRELDRETGREKDKERRRDRWHQREREKGREDDRSPRRSLGRDWGKQRDYRPDSRGRGRERKYRRRTQSPSRSRSRSFSNSRARLESLSVSPPKRPSSGKSHLLHRSRSYSDSPESIHGSLWRKPRSSDGPSASREHSQDGSSSGRKVTSRLDDIDRDGKLTPRDPSDGEASHKSRLSVFSREGSIRTRDLVRTDANEALGISSIPFYGIQEDEAEVETLDLGKEKTSVGSAPFYHVFLPGDTDDVQMLESDAGDQEAERPLFPDMRPLAVLKHPQSDTVQTSGLWESDKAIERSGYEFFPVKAGNVGDLRKPSTNPNLELGLGDRDGMKMQEPDPQPFFIHLVDTAGSSPEPAHRYTDSRGPPDMTVEFPLVTGKKAEPAKAEVGSLSLSLSVPQYRKEGNAWVKIEDAQAMLGDEDVNFALSL